MWINRLMHSFTSHYLIFSLIISLIIFSIFMFFTTKVISLPLDFHTLLEASSLSILIGYQIVLINYFHANLKSTFDKLKSLFIQNRFTSFSKSVGEIKLEKSRVFYLIIFLTIIPFLMVEIIRFWRWRTFSGQMPLYFSLFEPANYWAIALDVINHVIGYLMLFLLAIIIWNIFFFMHMVNALDNNTGIKIDIFHIDEMGGLRPLRNLILIIGSNYFIIITLAMISYISPRAIFSYETVFLVILLLIGIFLFIMTSKIIIQLLNKGFECELYKINEEYRANYNKLMNIISNGNQESNKEELEKLLLILDILENERQKLRQMRHKRFDFSTIITFIGSFLFPTVTLIVKIRGFML